MSSCKVPDFCKIWCVWTVFIKVPNVKLHHNLSSESRASPCRQRDVHDDTFPDYAELPKMTFLDFRRVVHVD
jgi:hypothetical protein